MTAPWMPLYVADYLADTGHLSAAEHGAYMLLIMHYWRQGSLPTDEPVLARIGRMTVREWARSRETIAAFFDGEWKHERIEEELRRANVKSTRRSEAGTRGGNAKALKNKKPALANATELLDKSLAKPLASSSQPQSEDISLRSISRREIDLLFDRFMAAFPKRINRKDARTKFEIALKAGVDPEKIIAAAIRYAEYVKFTEPRYVKAPDAWLNGAKYDDELPAESARPPPARAGPNGHRPRTMTELARMDFPDEPSPSSQTEPESPESAEPTVLGFAGRLSQPDRDQPGGQLLDLGQAGTRWRA